MSLGGKQRRAAGNSHWRDGNALGAAGKRWPNKKITVEQDASHRCARWPGD
jgi:hypothetical protein